MSGVGSFRVVEKLAGEGDGAPFPGKLRDQRFDQDAEGKPHAAVDDED